jgi:hypothetical protein
MLKTSLRHGIQAAVAGGVHQHVRILHEEPSEENFGPFGAVLDRLGKQSRKLVVRKLIESATSALSAYVKTRGDEFIKAAEEPADGVTLVVTLTNAPGLTLIARVIQGALPNLRDLSSIGKAVAGAARITAVAGFHK